MVLDPHQRSREPVRLDNLCGAPSDGISDAHTRVVHQLRADHHRVLLLFEKINPNATTAASGRGVDVVSGQVH